MAVYREHDTVEPVERQIVTSQPSGGLTSFALVKYSFILAITIVLLYFLAKYILPMFN